MELMKMNNLLKNILMSIFAVMLLTSTLTLGVQNALIQPKLMIVRGKKEVLCSLLNLKILK